MDLIRRRLGEIILLASVAICGLWLRALLLAAPPAPNLYPDETRLHAGHVTPPPALVAPDAPEPVSVVAPIAASGEGADAPEDLPPALRALRDEIVAEFQRQCTTASFSPMDFQYGDRWIGVALSDPETRALFAAYLYNLRATQPTLRDHLLHSALGAVARTHPDFHRSILQDALQQERWDVASAAINVGFVAGMGTEQFLAAAEPIAANSLEGQYSVIKAIWHEYQEGVMPEAIGGFCTSFLEQPSADLGALQFANFASEPFPTREAWVDYVARVSRIAATTDDIGRTHIAAVQIQMSSYEADAPRTLQAMRDRCEGAIAGIGAMVASPWPLLQYMGALQFDQMHAELSDVSGRP